MVVGQCLYFISCMSQLADGTRDGTAAVHRTRSSTKLVYKIIVYVVGHPRGFDLLTILLTRWHLKVLKVCLLVDFLLN